MRTSTNPRFQISSPKQSRILFFVSENYFSFLNLKLHNFFYIVQHTRVSWISLEAAAVAKTESSLVSFQLECTLFILLMFRYLKNLAEKFLILCNIFFCHNSLFFHFPCRSSESEYIQQSIKKNVSKSERAEVFHKMKFSDFRPIFSPSSSPNHHNCLQLNILRWWVRSLKHKNSKQKENNKMQMSSPAFGVCNNLHGL